MVALTNSSLPPKGYTSDIFSNSRASNVERMGKEGLKEIYPERLIVMRHSQRIDDLFPGWIERTRHGYKPYDTNMPKQLPLDRPVTDYEEDTPITVCGHVLAGLVGRSLSSQGIVPDVIYCSPAIRCIQTAKAVRENCGSKALLRIEPGLFENTTLYPAMKPCFASREQLCAYPIDWRYRASYSTTGLFTAPESINEYNNRIHAALRKISLTSEPINTKELNVLVVAHASTVDMAVGLLRNNPRFSTMENLNKIGDRVPYCSTVVLEPEQGEWKPNPYVIPPITSKKFRNEFLSSFVNR